MSKINIYTLLFIAIVTALAFYSLGIWVGHNIKEEPLKVNEVHSDIVKDWKAQYDGKL